MNLDYQFNDGGRSKYYKASSVGDCVVRAASIALGRDYKEVYNLAKSISGKSPRDGVDKNSVRKIMEAVGGKWIAVMKIGTGCKMHLSADDFPTDGKYIAQLSGHVCAVINGCIYDTFNPSRGGTRCVYGYWKF